MAWEFSLLRRNSPTPSITSNASTSSTSSTASIPVIYDSKTSRVESCDWKTFEPTDDLLEAEAEGTGMTADIKINIGSKDTPIFAHYAYVDLSNLAAGVRWERRLGRINQMFVRV